MEQWKRLQTDEHFRNAIVKRTQIIKHVRLFFDEQLFYEVETPNIVRLPGMEPYLHPFQTSVIDVNGKTHSAFLITSPEYAMKKLLAGGLENIYTITKCFRNNEDWKGRHNPEFTMIEWYRSYENYEKIIDDVIQLCHYVSEKMFGGYTFTFNGKPIDIASPQIITVREACGLYGEFELNDALTLTGMRAVLDKKGLNYNNNDSWDDLFHRVFLNEVEPYLGVSTLTILKDYPKQLAALSVVKKDDPRYAERFEAYLCGMELCNGFTELTDSKEQHERLIEEQAFRTKLYGTCYDVDESFIRALDDMPPAGGVALGIDRLVMCFTDSSKIEDVILFPMNDVFGV